MKPKLLIVTVNPRKFLELSERLDEFFDCEQGRLDEPEIQGTEEEILRHKIKRAYEAFKQPVLVDDVSAHFEALKGFPGPYIKHLWDYMTPYEVALAFAGTRMKAVCRLAVCMSPDDVIIAEGTAEGDIIKPAAEDHKGREFDLFLRVDGTDKPMIEFNAEEKNKFSHRGLALENLIELLKHKGTITQ